MGMRDLLRKRSPLAEVKLIGDPPSKRIIVQISTLGDGVVLDCAEPNTSLYLLRQVLAEAYALVNQKLIALDVAENLKAKDASGDGQR